MNQQIIAGKVRSSRHFVQNVLRDYHLNNSSMHVRRAAAPRSKMVEDVVEFLENEKLYKPSISSTELQQRLLLNGIVHHVDLPCFRFKQQTFKDKQKNYSMHCVLFYSIKKFLSSCLLVCKCKANKGLFNSNYILTFPLH